MIWFANRKPRAPLFSVCRYDGWRWFRRSILWTAGIGGNKWFFGFLRIEPDEVRIPTTESKGGQ